MNANSFFAMGRQHTVCQDYALTTELEIGGMRLSDLFEGAPSLLAVLADGCSSSPHTDFGSRFLVRSLVQVFLCRRVEPNEYATKEGCHKAEQYALQIALMANENLGLPIEALDATLLYAYPVEDEIKVVVHGDGVVAARHRNGSISHFVFECPKGAPDYLSYGLDDAREATYRRLIGAPKTCKLYCDGVFQLEDSLPVLEGVELWFPRSEYDLIVLMSDGARSFQRKQGTVLVSVPEWEVVQQVMSVRNFSGEFMARRIRNGFLGKFCVENGWQHYDDFAVAAIYTGEK